MPGTVRTHVLLATRYNIQFLIPTYIVHIFYSHAVILQPAGYQQLAAANASAALQKEFENLYEAYMAKNPLNSEPNHNCRMKVLYYDAVCLSCMKCMYSSGGYRRGVEFNSVRHFVDTGRYLCQMEGTRYVVCLYAVNSGGCFL